MDFSLIGLTDVPGVGSVSTGGYSPAGVAPLQFESLVTYDGYRDETEVVRYRTEQEAREGHLRLVQIFKAEARDEAEMALERHLRLVQIFKDEAREKALRASLVRENRGTGFDRGGW